MSVRHPVASPPVVLRRLRAAYGSLDPPPRRDPLEELILTVLSQNTSDTNRDRAWASLRSAFATWDEVADAPVGEVVSAIRIGGIAVVKAGRIQEILRAIRQDRGVIDLRFLHELTDAQVAEILLRLPGVGPKTAACVLAFSLGRPAMPVDTHVHRIVRRLGLVPPATGAGPAHRLMEDVVAPEDRLPLHVALIRHGRDICRARRPACDRCALEALCPRTGVDR